VSHVCVRIYLSIYSQRHITLYINRFASEASLQAIIALFIVSHASHIYVRVYTNPSTLNIVSHFWLIDLHQRRHIEASHLSSARHTCPICVCAHTYPQGIRVPYVCVHIPIHLLSCVRVYYPSTLKHRIAVSACLRGIIALFGAHRMCHICIDRYTHPSTRNISSHCLLKNCQERRHAGDHTSL